MIRAGKTIYKREERSPPILALPQQLALPKKDFERLEPYAGKLARTVLRGLERSNALWLLDKKVTKKSSRAAAPRTPALLPLHQQEGSAQLTQHKPHGYTNLSNEALTLWMITTYGCTGVRILSLLVFNEVTPMPR